MPCFGRQLPAEKPTFSESPQAKDEMVTDDHRFADALITKGQLVKKMEWLILRQRKI